METSHFIVVKLRSENGVLVFLCILKQVNAEGGQETTWAYQASWFNPYDNLVGTIIIPIFQMKKKKNTQVSGRLSNLCYAIQLRRNRAYIQMQLFWIPEPQTLTMKPYYLLAQSSQLSLNTLLQNSSWYLDNIYIFSSPEAFDNKLVVQKKKKNRKGIKLMSCSYFLTFILSF